MSGKSWYETGFEGMVHERDRIADKYAVDRFYMKEKTSASLVYIDDDPFCFYEHSYRKGGDRGTLTCIAKIHPETPVCCVRLGAESSHYVGMLTVLDCTEYPSKKEPGKIYQYNLKLFPAKMTVLQILQRKRTELVSLVNKKCAVYRDTDKSPNTGNDFTFKEDVKNLDAMFGMAKYKGKLLSEWFDKAEADPEEMRKLARTFKLARDPATQKLVRRIPPFNYAELLAPKDPEDVARVLAGEVSSSFDDKKPDAAGPSGGGGGNQASGAPF